MKRLLLRELHYARVSIGSHVRTKSPVTFLPVTCVHIIVMFSILVHSTLTCLLAYYCIRSIIIIIAAGFKSGAIYSVMTVIVIALVAVCVGILYNNEGTIVT